MGSLCSSCLGRNTSNSQRSARAEEKLSLTNNPEGAESYSSIEKNLPIAKSTQHFHPLTANGASQHYAHDSIVTKGAVSNHTTTTITISIPLAQSSVYRQNNESQTHSSNSSSSSNSDSSNSVNNNSVGTTNNRHENPPVNPKRRSTLSTFMADHSTSAPQGTSSSDPSVKKGPKFNPELIKKSRVASLVQEAKPVRHKSSSTSTLYVSSTLNSPDVNELLKCMSIRLYLHLEDGKVLPMSLLEYKKFEIFDEVRHPITKEVIDTTQLPPVDEIYKFINTIFTAERLSHECGILCLAYIERIMETSNIKLIPANWRRVVLSSLILASKVWEDQAVWNVDFQSCFPRVTVKDLAQLEKKYLFLLGYNVSLSASQYAKYYFELREVSAKGPDHFPLQPLDKAGQARLEARSKRQEADAKAIQEAKFKRSQSVDWDLHPKSPHAVLN